MYAYDSGIQFPIQGEPSNRVKTLTSSHACIKILSRKVHAHPEIFHQVEVEFAHIVHSSTDR